MDSSEDSLTHFDAIEFSFMCNHRNLDDFIFTQVDDESKRCNQCDVYYSSEQCRLDHLNGKRHYAVVNKINLEKRRYKKREWRPVKK